MNWLIPTCLCRSSSGEFTAEGVVPPDSPWFSGHFPQAPILPGIAQLDMVWSVIRNALGGEAGLRFTELSRVRFKQIIRPNDRIRIFAAPVKPGSEVFSFRIMINDNGQWPIACSGNATATISGRKS